MSEENGELVCEGGALECTGHRLEVCMIEKDRHDVVKYLGTIAVRLVTVALTDGRTLELTS